MRIVITGIPGTGKTSLGRKLAKKTRATFVEMNAFVKKNGLYHREKGEKELTVNLKQLEKALAKKLAGKKSFVVEGHLACEIKIPCDVLVVLRCEPRHLWNRLLKRKYGFHKIRDNVLAEILGYCGAVAKKKYKKIVEVDATRNINPKQLLEKLAKGDRVNWTGYLQTHERVFRASGK